MKWWSKTICTMFFLGVLLTSCGNEVTYIPKPLGFARVSLPEPVYSKTFDKEGCPFTYEYANEAFVRMQPGSCNHDVYYPRHKATLYASYVKLDNNDEKNSLFFHSESSRNLVYEHTIKADKIDETMIEMDSSQVYGITYEIGGNVASNYQFFISDTVDHFFRGALYFETKPNIDSIQPILDYIIKDVDHMIKTFRWRE